MGEDWKYLISRVKFFGSLLMILCGMFWLKLLYDKRRNRMDLILVLVIGIFLVILCLMIIRQVVLPYKKIENNMTLFLKGYTIDGLQDSETALTKEVDRIFSELIQLLKSEQMLNENKRQAQYLALQNQINPHFLYNTLESIRSEAMEAGMDSVVCMTEALAHFFRYTISNMENMVTLEEELDNINTYFLIQKYRFEERIGLTIEYDEEEHDHEHCHHDHEHDDEHHCCCGHHHDEHEGHHHHHHGHDADEVFESFGWTNVPPVSKDKLESILNKLSEDEDVAILRSKGMIKASDADTWYYFDMVPGEYELRDGEPDYTGRLCVIGCNIDEHRLEELFGI